MFCKVILLIVAYLRAVFFCLLSWRSCKQKRALSKARAAELSASPEGEKLQSDSGVFVDSHSLHDNQTSKGEFDTSSLKRRSIELAKASELILIRLRKHPDVYLSM